MDDADRLRTAGLRVTAARLAILDAVKTGAHPDVEIIAHEVRYRVGHVTVQAVYAALHALTEAGLVRRIEPAGGPARFEGRVGDNHHHHHLVCRVCGAVADVDCVIGHAPCLEPADCADYDIDEADVTFWGTCPSCQTTGEIVRAAATKHSEDDDFVQPPALFDNILSETVRTNLASNIMAHASAPEVTTDMKARVVEYWRNLDHDFGARVARGPDGD